MDPSDIRALIYDVYSLVLLWLRCREHNGMLLCSEVMTYEYNGVT